VSSHQRHLRRGFQWLGSATVIAKVIDLLTMLAVLPFLTKQQVGIASMVIAIGTVIEALDGLGTREALVQAPAVSRSQLDTLFWFIVGAAGLLGALVLVAAPLLQKLFGIAGMAIYFLAIAAKQPIVSAALIPLTMMNRDLQYERIAVVNVCASFGASLTRLGLAVSGAGVWALVAANCASGLYTLIGAQLARPFWPRPRFRIREISALVHFGMRVGVSNGLEQLFKNVDSLLIGWFYGPGQLAVYRVAFAIGMEPALAAGTLINGTALPIFARVSAVKEHLAQSLMWSLRRLTLLIAPLTAALILAAAPLTGLIHDGQGHSYAAAALPLKLLAAAALLRVTAQLLYPMVMGTGRPGTAARLSAVTLLLLSTGILIAGFSFSGQAGLVAVSAVWLAVYPLLLVWETRYLRQHWNIHSAELGRALIMPLIGGIALLSIVAAARSLTGDDPRIRLGIIVAAAAVTYGGLFLHERQRSYRTI
jgi:O-antigen/teichoic acid export membrane protein